MWHTCSNSEHDARRHSAPAQSSKAREKALRKERRKGRGAATDGDIGWLQEVGLDRLVEIEQKEIGAIKSLHGTDTLGTGEGNQILKALPAGTQRKTFKGYEEVRVPAGELEGRNEMRVPTSDDPW